MTHPAIAPGEVAVITGAGLGIGRAIAKRFVAEGMAVALLDIDVEHLHDARGEIGGQPEPLYVIGLDADNRAVRVGPKRMLAVESAALIETNAIGSVPSGGLTAKVRSLAKPVPVTLEGPLGEGASTRIRFETPEFGGAPGQAAVFYAGDRVVGGGWIDATTSVAS